MIASLRGKVEEVHASFFLLETGGVGYRVGAPPSVLSALVKGEERFVYIHDHIREESRDLYGFLTWADLELFERLLSISGVGPKVAMAVLSIGSAADVRSAILAGDLARLTSVPGVGKKTAQKIVLELKGALVDDVESAPGDMEVVDALVSLGYSSSAARDALKAVPADVADVQARIRAALKRLAP